MLVYALQLNAWLFRLMLRQVPSVTICFRESDEAAYGWPPRDKPAQDFLLVQHTTWDEGVSYYLVFYPA
jgi:hypothetical protein